MLRQERFHHPHQLQEERYHPHQEVRYQVQYLNLLM
jgi:hypothetical protein